MDSHKHKLHSSQISSAFSPQSNSLQSLEDSVGNFISAQFPSQIRCNLSIPDHLINCIVNPRGGFYVSHEFEHEGGGSDRSDRVRD